jgi:hypothetical protein
MIQMAILVHGADCAFKYGKESADTAIAELIEMPEFGGAPEVVDTTHLTSAIKTGIAGLQDPGSMDFKFYYNAATFSTVKALGNEVQKIQVTLSDGASFSFEGTMSIKYDGG